MRHTSRRIAVFLGLGGGSGRQMARGIRAYAFGRPWVFQFLSPNAEDISQVISWQPDGAIAEVWPSLREPVRALATRCPVVSVSGPIEGVPSVTVDSVESGRLAADYLRRRGFQRFASAWMNDERFARERHDGFRARVREEGLEVDLFDGPRIAAAEGWAAVEEALQRWLLALPKPVGLVADNDGQALRVLEAARQVGVHVPEQVAVLGVDDDELLCSLAQPQLSSVAQAFEHIGHAAASLLDRMLCGEAVAPDHWEAVPPIRVVTRHSTDVYAIADPDVAAAVRYIRDQAVRPIRVEDVLHHLPVSRRALERKFIRHLGRSPLDEINRAHVERAKTLLAETDFALPTVAARSGFSNVRRLGEVFRRHVGQSPGAWRRLHRLTDRP